VGRAAGFLMISVFAAVLLVVGSVLTLWLAWEVSK